MKNKIIISLLTIFIIFGCIIIYAAGGFNIVLFAILRPILYIQKQPEIQYILSDENHNPISKTKYHNIYQAGDNFFVVRKGSKYGLIDLYGKTVIPIKYYHLVKQGDYFIAAHQKENRSYYETDYLKRGRYNHNKTHKFTNKYTIFDKNAKKLLAIKSQKLPIIIQNGYILPVQDGKLCIYDFLGHKNVNYDYQELQYIAVKKQKEPTENNKDIYFKIKIADKWGVINVFGQKIIPVEYDQIYEYSPFDTFDVQKNGKWGKIDIKNNLLMDFISEKPLSTTDNEVYIVSFIKDMTAEKKDDINNVLEEAIQQKEQVNQPEKPEYKIEGELHVVSVYEGKDRNSFSENYQEHQKRPVGVRVETTEPVTLILDSYEPVEWNIIMGKGAKINRIYLSSYSDSNVNVANKNITVEKTSNYIGLTESNFYKVKELFGHSPKTYQYKYSHDYFFIDGLKGSKYNVMPTHLQTNESVRLQCSHTDDCTLFDKNLSVGVSKYGASSTAISNKYYKKGSGQYYFEAELIVPNINLNKIKKLKEYNNTHEDKKEIIIYDTPYINVGILSNLKEPEDCSFHAPQDEGRCFAYSAFGWCEQLLPNDDDGKFVVGIAVDFDKGVMLVKKNNESEWLPFSFRNDGREYTAAVEIADKMKWKMNFGQEKFKYEPPKNFKPYGNSYAQ